MLNPHCWGWDSVTSRLEAGADPEQLGEGNLTAIDVALAENRHVAIGLSVSALNKQDIVGIISHLFVVIRFTISYYSLFLFFSHYHV